MTASVQAGVTALTSAKTSANFGTTRHNRTSVPKSHVNVTIASVPAKSRQLFGSEGAAWAGGSKESGRSRKARSTLTTGLYPFSGDLSLLRQLVQRLADPGLHFGTRRHGGVLQRGFERGTGGLRVGADLDERVRRPHPHR